MSMQNKWVGLALAGALLVWGSLAHAAFVLEPAVAPVVTVTAGNADAPPFGQVTPTLTVTFDEPYSFTSLLLNIDYDANKMTFNEGLSTVVFMPFGGSAFSLDDLVTLSGGDFIYWSTESTPGSYSLVASFLTLAQSLPEGSSLVMSGVFDMTTLATGQTTSVVMSGVLTSTVADLDPTAVNDFSVSATVTAVPEPETWLMLLGGLGLIARRLRRCNR